MRGLGIDIIEIKRIEKAIARYGQKFLDRIFTSKEQSYCLKHTMHARHFSGRFAAKEAVVKSLGTGITERVGWNDIEILNNTAGKPVVHLSSRLKESFGDLSIEISISHCKEYATAVAICS